MPWKNGGGETAEIAVSPPSAGLDNFDWRVSTARVASDGPFSRFPGIDRTLVVLAGAGLRLSVDGQAPIVLTSRTDPIAFAGDVNADAALVGGEVFDLNVMTRRVRVWHRIKRIEIADCILLETTGDETLLYCVEGDMRVQTPTGSAILGCADALLSPSNGAWRLHTDKGALAYAIELFGASTADR